MDLSTVLYAASGIVGLLTLFGFSYNSVRQDMDAMKLQLHNYLTTDEVRIMIDDKIAPTQVGVIELSRRLDELRDSQLALTQKLDRVLDICNELNGRRERNFN